MELQDLICMQLGINKQCIRQNDHHMFQCLVPDAWVHRLRNGRFVQMEAKSYSKVGHLGELLLAPSNIKIQKSWTRIYIQAISKCEVSVKSLVEDVLCYDGQELTYAETVHQAADDYWRHVERSGWQKYAHAFVPKLLRKPMKFMDYNKTVEELLQRLFSCSIVDITSQQSIPSQHANPYLPRDICHPNVLPAIALLKSPTHFYVVHPFSDFTVQDIVTLSPTILSKSYAKNLFLAYQMLQAMKYCHSLGLSVGDLKLSTLFVDDKLWLRMKLPQEDRLILSPRESQKSSSPESSQEAENPGGPFTADTTKNKYNFDTIIEKYASMDLAGLTQMWIQGEVSNYDYLIFLNHLSGRRMGDPNNHPVLPWIMDFKSPTSGRRDLSRSKYRLNKGDQQLDHTYEAAVTSLPTTNERLHIAHHISDVLSDITYYVYKARRTPKSVLCAHVRPNWVPHEYPASIQRLQEWTPDECIPEFFTDPSIFSSIHPDLPDLEIPHWCSTPQDFVSKHMAALEGHYASVYLHHWIDLTFGYKLSGPAAVRAKNVCLQLVDEHTHLAKHGVVQLFTQPHPQRLSPHPPWTLSQLTVCPSSKSTINTELPDTQTARNQKDKKSKPTTGGGMSGEIVLPSGFNPLHMLEKLETFSNFVLYEAKALPAADKPQEDFGDDKWYAKQSLVSRDLQSLACALVCLLINPRTRGLGIGATLEARYILCRKVCQQHFKDIPRPFQEVLRVLFCLNEPTVCIKPDQYGALFQYKILSDKRLPPPNADLLLHSQFGIIPFPPYFPALFDTFYKYHIITQDIEAISASDSIHPDDKSQKLAALHKDIVSIFSKFLNRMTFDSVGVEGVELLLPYVEELFCNPATSVQSIWLLFAPISLMLGAEKTIDLLLRHIVTVFDDEATTSKHIKLYHRSFIIQLVVRLGLEKFLNSFSKPLIEACAGYKNFIPCEKPERQSAGEPEDILQHSITDAFLNEESSEQPVTFSLTGDSDSTKDSQSIASNGELTHNGDVDFLESILFEQDSSFKSAVQESDEEMSASKSEGDNQSENSSVHNQSIGSEDMGQLCGSVGRVSIHSVSRLLNSDCEQVWDTARTGAESGHSGLDSQVDEVATQAMDLYENEIETPVISSPDMENKPNESFMRTTSLQSGSNMECNISDVAGETIKWLSHRLGPVLTAKFLSRNLLRMLAVCYLEEEQLSPIQDKGMALSQTGRTVAGDMNASRILDCLACIAVLYGEHVILLQYFTHIKQLIISAHDKLTVRGEAGLVGCLSLIIHIIPYLCDATLMDILQETILADLLLPILRLVSSSTVSFPNGGLARRAICFKLIDVLYIVSMRIGFEMTRVHMTFVLQNFFTAFNAVYGDNEGGVRGIVNGIAHQGGTFFPGIPETAPESCKSESTVYALKKDGRIREYKIDHYVPSHLGHKRQGSEGSRHSLSPPQEDEQEPTSQTAPKEHIARELKETFTPEVAHAAYIPFCRLAGDIHIGQNLVNDDLIRQLCAIHDQSLLQQKVMTPDNDQPRQENNQVKREDSLEDSVSEGFGRNVSMVGNKITLQEAVTRGSDAKKKADEIAVDYGLLKSEDMELNQQRHLRGNWLQYWEHEVGLIDQQDTFNFKQIKLMTCCGPDSAGHSSSVRSMYVLDNENSFLSSSKDKTVKLWSLRNFGDGTGKVGCQWTYTHHRKSVFAVTFLESLRYAASCDSTVHVWDPFMGMSIRTFESSKNAPVTVLTSMPSPYTTLVTATTDSIVRFLDVRQGRAAHDFRCTTAPAGLIRCATVSPDGNWVAVGYSTGVVTLLDARTGILTASWKAHEGEILQIKAYGNKKLVTSSFDQSMAVWSAEDAKLINSLRGILEPVHCFNFYKNCVISASTANKIGVHQLQESKGGSSVTKLSSDVFRGVLTTMAVLPMNRILLLGADNGQIRLVA